MTRQREVYSTDQVIHFWAHQTQDTARNPAGNVHFTGSELYSYYTTIAAIIGNIIYISSNNMSRTTARHIHAARQAVRGTARQIFYTPAFTWYGNNPRPNHAAMILPAVRECLETLERALAAPRTRQQTKCNAIGAYLSRRSEIVALAEHTCVIIPKMPIISQTDEAVREYQEAKADAEQRAEAARLKAAKKQQAADKKAFTLWLTTGAGTCPSSYRRNAEPSTDYITISGDTVRTSQGAGAPLDHVIKALKFYDSRLLPLDADERQPEHGFLWREYHTNGHTIPLGHFTLDSIDEAGNVNAGCHTFTTTEIARFRKQWGEVLKAAKNH